MQNIECGRLCGLLFDTSLRFRCVFVFCRRVCRVLILENSSEFLVMGL